MRQYLTRLATISEDLLTVLEDQIKAERKAAKKAKDGDSDPQGLGSVFEGNAEDEEEHGMLGGMML